MKIKNFKIELLIFLTIFMTHGYFYTGQSWHQNSRLNTIFAFVESDTSDTHTLRINRFLIEPLKAVNTGDWAKVEGNYYSNKAPGIQFLGIPLYWVIYKIQSLLGISVDDFVVSHINAYLINLWLSIFFAALGAVFLYRLVLEGGKFDQRTSIAFTMVCFFSTLLLPFNSQLWGHTTAVYFSLIGFYFTFKQRHVLAGASLGLAVLCDNLAIFSLLSLLIYYLAENQLRKNIIRFIAGGIPFALILLLYQKLMFGSFFTAASVSVGNPWFDKPVVGGIFRAVSFDVLIKLLFSEARGLFIYMPIFLFGLFGAYKLFKNGRKNLVLASGLGIIMSLLLVSSFEGWHGGASAGPRYLILSFPLWFTLMSGVLLGGPKMKLVFFITGILNAFQMLVILCTTTLINLDLAEPLRYLYKYFFMEGLFFKGPSVKYFSQITPEQTKWLNFDIGHILGLEGFARLVPFSLFLILGLSGLWFFTKPNAKTNET